MNYRNFVRGPVSSLTGTESESELGNGSLYAILIEKLPVSRKSQYFRWLCDDSRDPSVKSLNIWLAREAKIEHRIQETMQETQTQNPQPLPKRTNQYSHWHNERNTGRFHAYATQTHVDDCPVCENKHPVHACYEFRSYDIDTRWQCAKALKLCFRCLSSFHEGKNCRKTERCTQSGCTASHHELLHDPKRQRRTGNSPFSQPQNPWASGATRSTQPEVVSSNAHDKEISTSGNKSEQNEPKPNREKTQSFHCSGPGDG